MKRVLLVAVALTAFAALAAAQSADEIVDRMDKELKRGETEGIAMIMDMKVPLLGEFSTKIKSRGKMNRADVEVKGEKAVIWTFNDTSWTYTPKTNQIEIQIVKSGDKSSGKEAEMLDDITEGYDVSIASETADRWNILCKKSKGNKSKDDPSKMDLVVSKKTWLPISLAAKMKGLTITLRDMSIGVSKAQVTFDPSAYKGATIVDKR